MSRNLRDIVIYGAGGHGREFAWLIEDCNRAGERYAVRCFIDDAVSSHGSSLNEIPVMGLDAAVATYPDAMVVGAIGSPELRERLMKRAEASGFVFETIVHPSVLQSQWIDIGAGTQICAGCILTTNIRVGHHVQINVGCSISHDVVLDDYATLAPSVKICGNVTVCRRAYLGAGAVVINGTAQQPLVIGEDAVVGAGACVTQSVPAGQTVVGVPAKPIGERR